MAESSRSRSESQPVACLPEEIIADILPRLPYKDLIRFRCVSKSWLNLISSPNSNYFTQRKLLVWELDANRNSNDTLKPYSLQSILSRNVPDGSHFLTLEYNWNQVVGTCNGLVCLLTDKRESFLIWNPSTGESKKLSGVDKSLRFCSFGFGYDKVSDDYKVVHIGYDMDVARTFVYSLRTNSCKNIGDFAISGNRSSHGLFVNGALVWKVEHMSGWHLVSSVTIVSLNLGNESYREIEKPDLDVENFFLSLDVVEGYMSMCCDYIGTRVDIWVMKEYGVRDSWVKLYTIPYPHIPERIMYMKFVLCNSVSGEILLNDQLKLMIYNSRYGTFEYKRFENLFPSSRYWGMIAQH